MTNLSDMIGWLEQRKNVRNRKITEAALLKINSLTVTIHGRLQLSEICLDEENDLPYEIRRMYWVLLREAPIEEYAILN